MTATMENVALRKQFGIRLATVRARLLGLSREDERALRRAHLVEGEDWHEFANGLCYSAAGLAKLEGVVANGTGNETTEGTEGTEKKGSDHRSSNIGDRTLGSRVRGLLLEHCGEAKGAPFLVRTMRCDFINRQVIEVLAGLAPDGNCLPGAAGPKNFMRVRSSENFLPGMLCWARVERDAAIWVFIGRGDREATEAPVCPRSRGRW